MPKPSRISISQAKDGRTAIVKIVYDEEKVFVIDIYDNVDKHQVEIDFIYPDGDVIQHESLYYGFDDDENVV